jgi:hypothetical protein
LAPTTHVWSATVQICATTALTKIENLFPEDTGPIMQSGIAGSFARGTHNRPSVSSVWAFVPEEHPSMATALKHLKFHKMPPGALMLRSITTAPAMQTIIVDRVPIVNP